MPSNRGSSKPATVAAGKSRRAAADAAPAPPPLIPGLELVGHGITIKPHSAYEIKPLFIEQDQVAEHDDKRLFHCQTNGTLYRVPKGYAVNASAPLPPGRILGRTVVKESFEYLEKELTVDASVAASGATMGIDVSAGSVESLRSSEDSMYALYDVFLPLWTVYLEDMSEFDHEAFLNKLDPELALAEQAAAKALLVLSLAEINEEIFLTTSEEELKEWTIYDLVAAIHAALREQIAHEKDEGARAYLRGKMEHPELKEAQKQARRGRVLAKRFFETFGTHYVSRVWVGGSVRLTLAISRSAQLSKDDIQQGIKASLPGLTTSTSKKMQEYQKRLARAATVVVNAQGGDTSLAAKFISLDLARLPEWLESVKSIPRVVHLDVAGIWTLIEDPTIAEDLRSHYEFLMTFRPPLSAAWSGSSLMRSNLHTFYLFFVRGSECTEYEPATRKTMVRQFKQLPGIATWMDAHDVPDGRQQAEAKKARGQFHTVDAAWNPDSDGIRKTYFFRGRHYISYNPTTREVDQGYPRLIQGVDPETGEKNWPGVPFGKISAVVSWGDGKTYFFSGGQYVRYDIQGNRADPGYPKPIQGNWSGVFDHIDAALSFGNGKIYFFRRDQYIRYDIEDRTADAGYPKPLSGGDIGQWKLE